MLKAVFVMIALSAVASLPAHAGVQQPTPQQRRDIEKRMGELEDELMDLRRQLGDGSRARARVFGPEIMRVGPGGQVFRVLGRMKFGFGFEAVGDSGVKVTTVTPSSPAEKIGIKTGDIVTMFNGVKLTGVEHADELLLKQAQDLEVGDTVGVEFRRGNEKKSGRMVAEDLGPNPALGFMGDSGRTLTLPRVSGDMPGMVEWESMVPRRWMDMELVSLDRDLGEYFGVPEGVLVVRAPKDSALALRSGDVILTIDGRKPTTPPQALRILRSYERGETFDILVLRQKKKVSLKGRVPEATGGSSYEYRTPEERYKVKPN